MYSCFIEFIKQVEERSKCAAYRAFNIFPSKFNKFNNTGAPILDSIYHMTLKLIQRLSRRLMLCIRIFWVKNPSWKIFLIRTRAICLHLTRVPVRFCLCRERHSVTWIQRHISGNIGFISIQLKRGSYI